MLQPPIELRVEWETIVGNTALVAMSMQFHALLVKVASVKLTRRCISWANDKSDENRKERPPNLGKSYMLWRGKKDNLKPRSLRFRLG